jgi:two-component system response regulator DesR
MITVLLAEDMHMVRGALVALLSLEPDINVVAEAVAGDEILPAARRTNPDVAVIDIDLPGIDGLTAAGEIHQHLPECRTLILTSHGRPGALRRALSAKVGGFLMKDTPAAELATAIREVVAGRRVIDSQLALAAWDAQECPLSQRELEVLRLVASGANPVDIAKALFLTPGTVRNYLTTISTKLGARNRTDAIRLAREADWI